MGHYQNYSSSKKLSKDTMHKKLSGVCAGVAKHYDFPRLGVRVAAIVALLSFPVATGVAYVVASVLLPTSKFR